MGILNIKDITVDWSGVVLHDPDDDSVTDGANGYLIEDILEQYGFPINRSSTTDLPGIEVKTKCTDKNSDWTIGRMTYLDITRTKWEDSTISKKMQRQYQVLYAKNPFTLQYKVTDARVVDFTYSIIQRELKAAYDDLRHRLVNLPSGVHETVLSGNYKFEYRPNKQGGGQSYSFRITVGRMQKLVDTSNRLSVGMFEFQ